jgi:RNA-directed DNA polymerase
MTAMEISSTGASPARSSDWKVIDWQKAIEIVRRLQMRIAKAIREGKHGKVKALQWLLTHSFYAKLLAVKRVTENSGRKTPGVDGIIWKKFTGKDAGCTNVKTKRLSTSTVETYLYPEKE